MHKEVVAALDLTPGALYIYAPWTRKKVNGEDVSGRWPQGRYKIIGIGQCVPVFQEMIAYEGIDGIDTGKMFFDTPWDFATRFIKVEVAKKEVAETVFVPLPEKTADHTGAGSYGTPEGKVADNRSHGKF